MTDPKSQNITWQPTQVTRERLEELHGHKGLTVWLTGLSGSGKSTVAAGVQLLLAERGCFAYVLDGDNVRHGLCRDLGFSPQDRQENIRRVGEVARLFTDAGAITISAFISPYAADRQAAKQLMAESDFVLVHVHAPLAVCEERDPKGLYRKARTGEIQSFTGISAPYETPEAPDLVLDTAAETPAESCARILALLRERGALGSRA